MNKQQIEKILNDAPEGATHLSAGCYFKHHRNDTWLKWQDNKTWGMLPKSGVNWCYKIQSLADLRAQLELIKRVEKLEVFIRKTVEKWEGIGELQPTIAVLKRALGDENE